jgi:NADH-quinone oxidoreductase subunit J
LNQETHNQKFAFQQWRQRGKAVMVLFLFVIKMLNIDKSTLRAKFAGYLPLGLLVAAVIVTEMAMVLGYNQFGLDVMAAPARHGADYSNITVLALQLSRCKK